VRHAGTAGAPGGRRTGCARQSHPRRSEKGEKCHVRIVSRLSNSRRSVARSSLCRVPLHALSGARSIMARHEQVAAEIDMHAKVLPPVSDRHSVIVDKNFIFN
jgi:hypothetical protein